MLKLMALMSDLPPLDTNRIITSLPRGDYFSRTGLQLAVKTIDNAIEKMHRLYEQKQTAPKSAAALDDYLIR